MIAQGAERQLHDMEESTTARQNHTIHEPAQHRVLRAGRPSSALAQMGLTSLAGVNDADGSPP